MASIWLAGGCFWGTERLFSMIDGVTGTEAGYANGDESIIPTYEAVCMHKTGYRETVRVDYDPEAVSLDYLLYSYYLSIDPSLVDQQGNDCGPQYQACIFWNDPESEKTVRRISAVEAERHDTFNVVLEKLRIFVPAEEYHQRYLEKNPKGYCHISSRLVEMISKRKFDPGIYSKPDDETLRKNLTPMEYWITQEGGTETPFTNEYDGEFSEGIYVDKVTGEPLFLSKDKYDSGCGWPAFSNPLDENAIVYCTNNIGGLVFEARSRVGNTHLGHLFLYDKTSPNGKRYCIDSASIRFIPRDRMESEGYGEFIRLLEGYNDRERHRWKAYLHQRRFQKGMRDNVLCRIR